MLVQGLKKVLIIYALSALPFLSGTRNIHYYFQYFHKLLFPKTKFIHFAQNFQFLRGQYVPIYMLHYHRLYQQSKQHLFQDFICN